MVIPTVFKPPSKVSIYSQIWVDGCKKLDMEEGCHCAPAVFLLHTISATIFHILYRTTRTLCIKIHLRILCAYIMYEFVLHIMYELCELFCTIYEK